MSQCRPGVTLARVLVVWGGDRTCNPAPQGHQERSVSPECPFYDLSENSSAITPEVVILLRLERMRVYLRRASLVHRRPQYKPAGDGKRYRWKRGRAEADRWVTVGEVVAWGLVGDLGCDLVFRSTVSADAFEHLSPHDTNDPLSALVGPQCADDQYWNFRSGSHMVSHVCVIRVPPRMGRSKMGRYPIRRVLGGGDVTDWRDRRLCSLPTE